MGDSEKVNSRRRRNVRYDTCNLVNCVVDRRIARMALQPVLGLRRSKLAWFSTLAGYHRIAVRLVLKPT